MINQRIVLSQPKCCIGRIDEIGLPGIYVECFVEEQVPKLIECRLIGYGDKVRVPVLKIP